MELCNKNVIVEEYASKISFAKLTIQDFGRITSNPISKVLMIDDCTRTCDVWNKLREGYSQLINESPNLLLLTIVVPMQESNRNSIGSMTRALNLEKSRPFIVQVVFRNKEARLYFKDDDKQEFQEIATTETMTLDDFQSAEKFDFELLIGALQSELIGDYKLYLMDTKLSTNDTCSEAETKFASSSILCLKFLMLFKTEVHQVKIVEAALASGDMKHFMAAMSIKYVPEQPIILYQQDHAKLLNLKMEDGRDLLMLAAEKCNFQVINFLIYIGANIDAVDNSYNRAVDICLKVQAFYCLAILLYYGSPFPKNFNIDDVSSSEYREQITSIMRCIDSFHGNIKVGNVKEVEKFIAECRHIKHAYSSTNKCAITVALENRQAEIYALLISNNYKPGADIVRFNEGWIQIENKRDFSELLRFYNLGHFSLGGSSYLDRLYERCWLATTNEAEEEYSYRIRTMLRKLDSIPLVKPILKLCSLCDHLQIRFDFMANGVGQMDPEVPFALGLASGVTCFDEGIVYIAAGNYRNDFRSLTGTLIHELSHHAMNMLYENAGIPYRQNHRELETNFNDIVEKAKIYFHFPTCPDSTISSIFAYYTPDSYHSELIVRVPQLLAQDDQYAINYAQLCLPELFTCWSERVLPDANAAIKKEENARQIRSFRNSSRGFLL